jgi:hypothetical protein
LALFANFLANPKWLHQAKNTAHVTFPDDNVAFSGVE